MARARPLVAGGGGAAPPERAGPGRPRRSGTGHHCYPERPGLRAAPQTPEPGAGRRAAKLRLGRGLWALLLLQLHLLRALAQGRCGPGRGDTPEVDFVGATRGGFYGCAIPGWTLGARAARDDTPGVNFVGATWSILGMDISEVTLQVDTYGLGFRAVRSWGDTLGCTLWVPPGDRLCCGLTPLG